MVDVKEKVKPRTKPKFKRVKTKIEPEEEDFVIKGKSAEDFYQKIMSPAKNTKRDQFTDDALKLFPDPSKPNKISLKLKDE